MASANKHNAEILQIDPQWRMSRPLKEKKAKAKGQKGGRRGVISVRGGWHTIPSQESVESLPHSKRRDIASGVSGGKSGRKFRGLKWKQKGGRIDSELKSHSQKVRRRMPRRSGEGGGSAQGKGGDNEQNS